MPNLIDRLMDVFADLLDGSGRGPSDALAGRARKAPLDNLDRAVHAALHDHRMASVALASATVASRRETARLDDIISQIADIEARAVLALRGGRADLAERSAETIAALEAQRNAQAGVCAETAAAVQALQTEVETGRLRLQKLHHGRQIAAIRAAAPAAQLGANRLDAAEEALAGVTAAQEAAALMRVPDNKAREIVAALGEAGFGSSQRSAVDAIMSRLVTAAGIDPQPETSQPAAPKLIGACPTAHRD